MTDMEYFHDVRVFQDAVIDQDWAVNQLADSWPSLNHRTHARKSAEQVNVIEQGAAEPGSYFRVVFGNEADDFGKIA